MNQQRKSYFPKTPNNNGRASFGRGSAFRQSNASNARFTTGPNPSLGFRPSIVPGADATRKIATVPKILNIKDNRNLRDREVQTAMIAKIVNFLDAYEERRPQFDYSDRNFLRVPTRPEFKSVFDFVFQCIQPNFQLTKIDDEVPRLMNNLGYPFPLKLSHMQTMTTLPKWAEMLAILEWLTDFVQIDIASRNENKVGDAIKWHFVTSCYRKYREGRGGGTGQDTMMNYQEEFDAYRQARLEENEQVEDLDEVRARMTACDQKLREIQQMSVEEKAKIQKVEGTIADIEADIEVLGKYSEDIGIKTSQNEQILEQDAETYEALVRKCDALGEENQAKEGQIAAQKISGNEARQLMVKRQSYKEELAMLRGRCVVEENKIFNLQPDFFKLSAKIRSDYKALISALHSLCELLCNNSAESRKLLADLESDSLEEAFQDLQISSTNNKLAKLLAHLKEQSEWKLVNFKHSEESSDQVKADLRKEIRELESVSEQEQTRQKLEIERARRERDDKMRPVRDHKHSLNLVKQKRGNTSEELQKYTEQFNKVHETLADKHMKLANFKQGLDAQYSELQALVLEKMTKLCDRFEQIQGQKGMLKQLGEMILRTNAKTLSQMENQK